MGVLSWKENYWRYIEDIEGCYGCLKVAKGESKNPKLEGFNIYIRAEYPATLHHIVQLSLALRGYLA